MIFSCDLRSLYPVVHFLSMWLSGITVVINSNRDSASLWYIPLWIFALAKLHLLAVNSTFHIFMAFWIKFMTSSDIFYILRQFIIQSWRTISYISCSLSRPRLDFSARSCSRWGCADLYRVALLCLLNLCGIISVPQLVSEL